MPGKDVLTTQYITLNPKKHATCISFFIILPSCVLNPGPGHSIYQLKMHLLDSILHHFTDQIQYALSILSTDIQYIL